MSQTLLIRADASTRFGQGHTLRNRHLADAFLQAAPGARVIWAATAETFALVPPIRDNFTAVILPDAPQRAQIDELAKHVRAGAEKPIFVTDGYHLDHATLDAARAHGLAGVSLFIDEKADRNLGDQDFIVDYLPSSRSAWEARIGPRTEILSGPDYQMVSPRFKRVAENRSFLMADRIEGYRRTVLVMNGGFNIGGMVEELIDHAMQTPERWKDVTFKICVMSGSPSYKALAAKVEEARGVDLKFVLLTDNAYIPDHIGGADLYIGASGMTPFELGAAGGIPSVLMAAGHNQDRIAKLAESRGAGIHAGAFLKLRDGALVRTENASEIAGRALDIARNVLDSAYMNDALSKASRAFCDGRGAARVAARALEAHTRLRAA